MAGKKPDTGQTAVTVATNVKRLRTKQNLTYTQLSARLKGWSLSPVAIRRIEEQSDKQPQRRVDVDDLMALAVALEVSPLTLLMPDTESADQPVAATSIEDVSASTLWKWLRADRPIGGAADGDELVDFYVSALPVWRQRELAEGLTELADLQAGGDRAARIMEKYGDN